jgi:hypothetical protein
VTVSADRNECIRVSFDATDVAYNPGDEGCGTIRGNVVDRINRIEWIECIMWDGFIKRDTGAPIRRVVYSACPLVLQDFEVYEGFTRISMNGGVAW